MIRSSTRVLSALLLMLALMPRIASANGADLPAQIIVQGFVKQERDRVRLVIRVPLVLLSSFGFPKRGPGYLDLANIDERLRAAASATAGQVKLTQGGQPLRMVGASERLAPLSDRSFRQYDTAVAHFEEPPLPVDTNLFWDQGFFDARLDYAVTANSGAIGVRIDIAPELGDRLKVRLQYMPVDGPPRTFEIPGGAGHVSLDPAWHEAAWLFMRAGFAQPFAWQRVLFVACLIAPFRRLRSLVVVMLALAVAQAITLTAVARDVVEPSHWLPAIVVSTLAATSFGLAIGNLASPSLRRRWFLAAIIGGLGGFGVGHYLADLIQFAGQHPLVASASFNAGVALGEVAMMLILFVALRLLFRRVMGPLLGVIVLSAVLGLVAGQWVMQNNPELAHELGHAVSEDFAQAAPVLLWMLPALLIGLSALLLRPDFGGARVTTLRDALQGRGGEERARS